MSDEIIRSNVDEVVARLERFVAMMPVAMTEWADTASVSLVEALKTQAPVGKRDDPRKTGPHMRDRIQTMRQASGFGVTLKAFTDVGLYPYYVIGGVSGGAEITPKGHPYLMWFDGDDQVFARKVTQGAIAANPFNERAWGMVESAVMAELNARLASKLR